MRKFIYLILVLCFNLHAQDYYLASYQQANAVATYTPVARVNIGSAITATDGFIDWEGNNSISQIGTNYSVVGLFGSFYDLSGETLTRDTSIPSYINSTDLSAIDDYLRYADDTITYTFPVANADYRIVIYGMDTETEGLGKITINGDIKESDFNWADRFGIFNAAAIQFDITVINEEIVVVFEGETFGGVDYGLVMAIEILKKD